MRLHIPRTGDGARLLSDWDFALHQDWRNRQFHDTIRGLGASCGGSWQTGPAHTLPAGTELVFDRVYIRQDKDEFASVTFVIKEHPTRDDMVGERFWVKLDDANRLEIELTGSDNPVGGFAKATYQALLQARRSPEAAKRQEDASASRKALAAARDYARELCSAMSSLNRSSFEVQLHVEGIINAVLADEPHVSTTRAQDVRWKMTNPPRTKASMESWHSRSTVNKDGSVTRDLRFVWRTKKKYAGFRLTMSGTEVTSCVLLP